MTLIFDYDGTLHDTAAPYGVAVREAAAWLTEQGCPPERELTDAALSRYLGMTAQEMWTDFMPGLDEGVRQEASAMIGRSMIRQVLGRQSRLYPGIPEALDALRKSGHRLLILSNCARSYMDAQREAFGLDRWFSGYFCAGDYGFRPKEEVFSILREAFPDRAYCMIGDRASDLRVALVHGLPSVGCAYGFGNDAELAEAKVRVRAPAELPAAVAALEAEGTR
ncbi:MAG: HAD family hydrolase [Oscillospiraceae bacterium]|nr:HAD family hydrolase [Oscillospiraceae bacterium]